MHIFKQPHIGGEVTCHQDATFLSTDPQSVMGLWVALEDATLDNGCLWAEPGGHRGPLRQVFSRAGASDADGTRFTELDPTPLPPPGPDGPLVPLEVAAGTMVVLHGRLPHWSGPEPLRPVPPGLLPPRHRRCRRLPRRQLAATPPGFPCAASDAVLGSAP